MKIKKTMVLIMVFALLVLTFSSGVQKTQASDLTGMTDILSSTKPSTQKANHDLRYRQITQISAGTIVIDLNTSGFASGTVDYTDIDFFYGSSQVQVNGSCVSSCTNATLAAAAGAAIWGAAIATNDLTLTYPTSAGVPVNANDYVRIQIGSNASGGDQAYTNPASTGSKTISIISGSDSGNLAVVIITDDQIAVSAAVTPTLSFSISDLIIGFGAISADSNIHYATGDGNVATTEPANDLPTKLTASTNAASGLVIMVKSNGDGSSSAGLYSSTVTDLIEAAASTAVAANTDGYGVYAKHALSLTADEAFDNDSAGDVAITRTAATFASTTGVVSGGTIDLSIKTGVGATTKAGNYSDTLTVICSGNF